MRTTEWIQMVAQNIQLHSLHLVHISLRAQFLQQEDFQSLNINRLSVVLFCCLQQCCSEKTQILLKKQSFITSCLVILKKEFHEICYWHTGLLEALKNNTVENTYILSQRRLKEMVRLTQLLQWFPLTLCKVTAPYFMELINYQFFSHLTSRAPLLGFVCFPMKCNFLCDILPDHPLPSKIGWHALSYTALNTACFQILILLQPSVDSLFSQSCAHI